MMKGHELCKTLQLDTSAQNAEPLTLKLLHNHMQRHRQSEQQKQTNLEVVDLVQLQDERQVEELARGKIHRHPPDNDKRLQGDLRSCWFQCRFIN